MQAELDATRRALQSANSALVDLGIKYQAERDRAHHRQRVIVDLLGHFTKRGTRAGSSASISSEPSRDDP